MSDQKTDMDREALYKRWNTTGMMDRGVAEVLNRQCLKGERRQFVGVLRRKADLLAGHAFPIERRVYPPPDDIRNMSQPMLSVQPMALPKGLCFYTSGPYTQRSGDK